MRIHLKTKILEIFTETTRRQKSVLAMILIFILEMYALNQGVDGSLLALAMSIIAGLGGYHFGRKK